MLEALKLDQITISEQFLMMEELWDSMSQNATANNFTPQWHLDTLVEREEKIQNNELSFSDITDVKERLKSMVK